MQRDKPQQEQPLAVGQSAASSRNMKKGEYLFNETTAARLPTVRRKHSMESLALYESRKLLI